MITMSFEEENNDKQLRMQKLFIQSRIDKAFEANKLRHDAALVDLQHSNDQVLEYEMLSDLDNQNLQFIKDVTNFKEYCDSLDDCRKLRAIALAITVEENPFDNITEVLQRVIASYSHK